MTVLRVVPVITVADVDAARRTYVGVLGMVEVMNHGWIVTFAAGNGSQISVMSTDLTAPCNPDLSIQVDDVPAAFDAAVAAGMEIIHPLTDEPWGVRRFFFRDHVGTVVNVLTHR